MLNWLRRRLGPPLVVGTLTLLPDMAILGLPGDITHEEAHRYKVILSEWLDLAEPRDRALVFPFPVQVIDKRERKQ